MSTELSVVEQPVPAVTTGPLAAVRRIAVVPAFNEERNIARLLAELAVRLDGDGQHDPAQLRAVVAPVAAGEADLAIGSRFLEAGGYRSSAARRIGIRVLARVVSWIAHERLTDTTSGFQALNRRTIRLFAADLPRDYPEVEGLVMALRHHLRVKEVPVTMREREHGRSSIGSLASVYYMIKVLLAVFVDLFRRDVVPEEGP